MNDFDETLPGPFEYDVKRMAASFTIAARNNGFSKADARAATLASVAGYREAMAGFAQMTTMEVWYAHLNSDEIMAAVRKAREGQTRRPRRPNGPRRWSRRRGPATASRRCRSSVSSSTADTGS